MRKFAGNTLPEYVLIGGLLFLVSLGALFMLGNNLNGILVALKSDFSRHQGGSVQALQPGGQAGGGSGPPGPAAGGGTICFTGGLCLDVPVIKPDPDTMTSGGLGGEMTGDLARVLEQLAEQLKREGADKKLVDLVSRLANKGHDMADQQKEIWKEAEACIGHSSQSQEGRLSCWWNDSVAGTMQKVSELGGMRGEFQSIHNELKQYLTRHPDALSAFPEAKAIIDQEVALISKITENVTRATSQDFVPEVDRELSYAIDLGTLTEGIPYQDAATLKDTAARTHESADDICDQGGNNCHRGGG